MKLLLLFLLFISTAYAELEWKTQLGYDLPVCFTNLGPTFEDSEGQTSGGGGSQFYYTLSGDCYLYNLYNYGEYSDYVYIDDIEVSIRGTRNNESTTINENTDLVTVTAISGNRHFSVNGENAKLTLRYVKLVGGDVSSYNSIIGSGGSILIWINGGELNLYSSIVFNNKANYGGGIRAKGDSSINNNVIMNIYNSVVQNNEATDGGGIYMEYANGTIHDTIISNNNADNQGGGLWIGGDSTTVTLRQPTFDNNGAPLGDEIYTDFSPTISLINMIYINPNNNNNIFDVGFTTWKTCGDSPCNDEETCSVDSNFPVEVVGPGEAVRCEPVSQQCVINIEITGTCTDEEKKQALIDKYKEINSCT